MRFLQVALYYKEEGVLFLLLNHFLKICNGNVARCYDETAEAIATANGYSHLMDFFQYYDCIARCVAFVFHSYPHFHFTF